MRIARALLRSWALRQAAGLLFLYVAFAWLFEREAGSAGLFDVTGRPDYVVVALGLFDVVTRIVTRFLVPALVVLAVFAVVERLGLAASGADRPAGRG